MPSTLTLSQPSSEKDVVQPSSALLHVHPLGQASNAHSSTQEAPNSTNLSPQLPTSRLSEIESVPLGISDTRTLSQPSPETDVAQPTGPLDLRQKPQSPYLRSSFDPPHAYDDDQASDQIPRAAGDELEQDGGNVSGTRIGHESDKGSNDEAEEDKASENAMDVDIPELDVAGGRSGEGSEEDEEDESSQNDMALDEPHLYSVGNKGRNKELLLKGPGFTVDLAVKSSQPTLPPPKNPKKRRRGAQKTKKPKKSRRDSLPGKGTQEDPFLVDVWFPEANDVVRASVGIILRVVIIFLKIVSSNDSMPLLDKAVPSAVRFFLPLINVLTKVALSTFTFQNRWMSGMPMGRSQRSPCVHT